MCITQIISHASNYKVEIILHRGKDSVIIHHRHRLWMSGHFTSTVCFLLLGIYQTVCEHLESPAVSALLDGFIFFL